MAIVFIKNSWDASLLDGIEKVLDTIQQLFIPLFEITSPQRFFVAKIEGDHDPCCNREYGIIYLNVNEAEWCRSAYQFSHEFCHFQIKEDVAPPFRWFEETICQLASHFFLPLVDRVWSNCPPYPNWRSYASSFSEYVNNEMMKAEFFNTDFGDESNNILSYLMNNCEDRPKNTYIAKLLLPIFQSDPTLWSTVPFLCAIPETLAFEDALHFWCEVSPVMHKKSIYQISRIFYP